MEMFNGKDLGYWDDVLHKEHILMFIYAGNIISNKSSLFFIYIP